MGPPNGGLGCGTTREEDDPGPLSLGGDGAGARGAGRSVRDVPRGSKERAAGAVPSGTPPASLRLRLAPRQPLRTSRPEVPGRWRVAHPRRFDVWRAFDFANTGVGRIQTERAYVAGVAGVAGVARAPRIPAIDGPTPERSTV